MINISALLDEIKASPFREIIIRAPHTGESPLPISRPAIRSQAPRANGRKNPAPTSPPWSASAIPSPSAPRKKAEVSLVHDELEGQFVEAGTPLAVLRHMLTSDEVQRAILQKALHLFRAPERAKYYFTPEVDKKIRASDAHSVIVREGMELFIMSRMKREVPLSYSGPNGVIYAVYFKYNDNMDVGAPLIGVCPQDQLPAIQDVIMRVQTEWTEKK